MASTDSVEWRPEETVAPKTPARQILSKKILSSLSSWWQVPASHLVPRLPKPLIQFLERKLLFPGASPNARKHAPSLGALKASLLKSEDASQFHLAERIQEVHFISQHESQSRQHRAWFIPPQGKMPTILVSGPNMGHLSHILDLLPFTLVGYGVLTYEYPGYGKTGGKTSETSLYSSVEAASDYLSQQHHIPAQQQIGYGVSLGGAVTVHLAAQRPLKGVILESTFTSTPEATHRLMQKHLHPTMTGNRLSKKLQYRFDNTAKMGQIQCPLLILHADEDPLLPVDFAHSLYQKAASRNKKLTVIERKSHLLPANAVNQPIWGFLDSLDHSPIR